MGDGAITRAVQAHGYDVTMAHWLPWRTGSEGVSNIYAQLGERPESCDPVIGAMVTPVLAAEAVACHNELLSKVQSGGGS